MRGQPANHRVTMFELDTSISRDIYKHVTKSLLILIKTHHGFDVAFQLSGHVNKKDAERKIKDFVKIHKTSSSLKMITCIFMAHGNGDDW